jgi:hypothetical protein
LLISGPPQIQADIQPKPYSSSWPPADRLNACTVRLPPRFKTGGFEQPLRKGTRQQVPDRWKLPKSTSSSDVPLSNMPAIDPE